MSRMCSVARTIFSGCSKLKSSMSCKKLCVYFSVYSPRLTPAASAFSMVRSSTSVMFITWKTSKPRARSHRRRMSWKTKVRKLPMWA